MDLSKFQNIVRRYLWLFVLAPLVASLTTIFVVSSQPPSYRATTRLLVGPGLESPSPDLNSLRIGGQLTQTYAELADTRAFLESVNNKLDRKTEIESLNKMITTRQNVETRLLTVIVYHPDPNQAVAIAKAAADTFMERSPARDNTTELLRTQMSSEAQQLEQIVTKSEVTIQQLEAELFELKSASVQRASNLERQNLIGRQLAEERAHWSDALRTLTNLYQMLLDTNTNQLEIIEPAGAVTPVNDDVPLKAAASGIAGLILALIIAFAFEYSDDTIRSSEDLSRDTQAPLLSKVEKHDRLSGSGLERAVAFAQPTSRAANSYRTAVSKLLFSIGNLIPHTLFLSSAGSQSDDDTATATVNLAVAFAQAGHRVVVVDAQLHNPVLTRLFNADTEVGLSDLLIANSTELQLKSIEQMSRIQFLPSGLSSEEGSAAALNPAKIVKVLEELQRETDIVLVAGSPISSSAESLTLASQVNGVILVARQGEAHMKTVNEVVESLNAMKIQLTGIIFDENPSPFMSKRNVVSPVAAEAPKRTRSGSLQASRQVDFDMTRPSDLTSASIAAGENLEPTPLDQVDIETVQTPDMENLPAPADEIEVSNFVAVDVNPVSSSNTTDSITSADDLPRLEEVTVDLPQTQDQEAAMFADENAELPEPGQDNVDMTRSEEAVIASAQTEDLEAAMPAEENTELPTLGLVDADTMPSPEFAGAETSSDENLELLRIDRVEADLAESPGRPNSEMHSQENLELALLDPNVKEPEADHSKNPNGSRRANRRRSHRHS
jgi:capsular polysaccharide biosynthesis protein/Mrp family chromosome partitioning ATPase